ncbi:hypothetical protein U9M48_033926 [Paspalum notatum var. saurae]|uniref:Uncharacterized protein n=1 Tax=Paspalum notatum var. saurae TaxID=547442 RepID=A0AAQ3UCJ1_PASNO
MQLKPQLVVAEGSSTQRFNLCCGRQLSARVEQRARRRPAGLVIKMHKGDDGDDDAAVFIDVMDAADECPAGVDPLQWRRLNYTCGLRNEAFGGMFLVSLLFIVLAAVVLPRTGTGTPAAPVPAPAVADDGEPLLPPPEQCVSVVWTVSLLLSSYLGFWIYTLSSSHTTTAAAIFIRFSYGAMLAHAAGSLAGPVTGMTLAHLGTACAAGLLGHALAEYRMRDGIERAADEAAARTMAATAEAIDNQSLAFYYSVFVSSMPTLLMAARVVWLVFFPSYSYFPFLLFELNCLVYWTLYFWAIVVALPKALISVHLMMRLMCYHLGSFFLAIILCFVLFPWLWIYYFGLQMMGMAALFGYLLALNTRYKDILLLAREQQQPVSEDIELGGAVQPQTGNDA